MSKYEFFKAYIPINEKKRPLMKFKGVPFSELLTLEEAKEHKGYAGILNENTVLIDVDDGKHAEKMLQIVKDLKLKTRVYKTTRGMHFLFLNNGTFSKDKEPNQRASSSHLKTVCGLHIDYKTGISNCLENLKIGGELRPVIYDIEDGEEYETVPKFILPCFKVPTIKDENGKTVEDRTRDNFQLFGMKDGDGRNEALRDWKNYLYSSFWEMSPKEIKDIFKNITNKYVFSDPLPEEEIETICRPEAFIKFGSEKSKKSKKSKKKKYSGEFTDDDGKPSHNKIGDSLIEKYHVKNIGGILYTYDGVCYKAETNIRHVLEQEMISLIPNATTKFRNETISYMKLKVPSVPEETNTKYVGFKNGLFNVETGELERNNPYVFVKNIVPHNYNPEVYSPRMDKFLNDCCSGDTAKRSTLEECTGYSFTSSTACNKMFILYGETRNGKSTYLNVFEIALGRENYSTSELAHFGLRFGTSVLLDKVVNVGDDIKDSTLSSETISIIKKITAGNSLDSEFKGKDKFTLKPYAKLWYACNTLPKFRDETGALLNRLILIPFTNFFKESDSVAEIEKSFTEEDIEYFIKVSIDGLKRVVMRGWKIKTCSACDRLLEELVTHTDSIELFLTDVKDTDLIGKITGDVYREYVEFCGTAYEHATQNAFTREVKRRFNLSIRDTSRMSNGKKRGCKVFVKEEITTLLPHITTD